MRALLCPSLFLLVLMMRPPHAAVGRPITVDDLLAVQGVSDPQLSPDGKLIVYVLSKIDRAANKSASDLWIVPASGGEPRPLTAGAGSNSHPRWSPDGTSIAFTSTRSGSSQIWILPMQGGEARPLTKLPIDVAGPVWSPQGDRIACTAAVYPGQSPEQTAETDKKNAAAKSSAKIFDQMMIRHWDSWETGKKSHLFVVDVATGQAADLTPAWKANIPPAPFGGSSDYSWSADGKSLAFTSEPLENHAWSTNTDIWLVPAAGGEPQNLTAPHQGADAQPAFSPDGRFLAFLRQDRPGFEADQWVLHILRADKPSDPPLVLTKGLDRPVQSFSWKRNEPAILAVIDDNGYEPILDIPVLARRPIRRVAEKATLAAVSPGPDGAFACLKHDSTRPPEVHYAAPKAPALEKRTRHNDPLFDQLDLPSPESFSCSGADGTAVQGWLVKPPGFDPARKYPVVFLIHGGPQGAWHDEWHNRWNPALFASPDYCVLAVNPRGSTGFGQSFTDQISRDWNGKVYEDLMKALDHALAAYPFLDPAKIAAAGASYGGYMINWIAGHSDRFACLVSHAGIFDLTSMNISTEELWFSEWEFGGSPWDTPDLHLQQSPSSYVKNFKTPTLVIHGALDFRVPDTQGIAMFHALQRRGVPSRLVYFPDEGHWITRPGNRALWWNEVLGWINQYLK